MRRDATDPTVERNQYDGRKLDARSPDSSKDLSKPKPDTLKPDTLKPDTLKPDALKPDSKLIADAPSDTPLLCPTSMASFPGFCIDQNEGVVLSWTAAAATCGLQGKRLCHLAEWQTACNSVGKGMTNMTGDWEWLIDIYSATDAATSARKAGGVNCTSLSYATIGSSYRTRCCK